MDRKYPRAFLARWSPEYAPRRQREDPFRADGIPDSCSFKNCSRLSKVLSRRPPGTPKTHASPTLSINSSYHGKGFAESLTLAERVNFQELRGSTPLLPEHHHDRRHLRPPCHHLLQPSTLSTPPSTASLPTADPPPWRRLCPPSAGFGRAPPSQRRLRQPVRRGHLFDGGREKRRPESSSPPRGRALSAEALHAIGGTKRNGEQDTRVRVYQSPPPCVFCAPKTHWIATFFVHSSLSKTTVMVLIYAVARHAKRKGSEVLR